MWSASERYKGKRTKSQRKLVSIELHNADMEAGFEPLILFKTCTKRDVQKFYNISIVCSRVQIIFAHYILYKMSINFWVALRTHKYRTNKKALGSNYPPSFGKTEIDRLKD